MDPERTTRPNPEPLDDAALGALVREIADDWRMPPQRLDDVTWRDRVGRRGRAGGGGSGPGWRWTRRLVGAASLALVATVVLSVTAVFLTAPRSGPAVGTASGSPTPGASATPERTPLPKLAVNGDLPSVTSFLVDDGEGTRLVDLTTGDASASMFPIGGYPHVVVARPDGAGWLCFCATLIPETSANPGRQRVELQTTAAPGQPVERRDLRTLAGRIGTVGTDRPQSTDAQVTISPDGRLAFLGWSQHDLTTGWSAGIDVLDLATLDTVTTIDLPSVVPTAATDLMWVRVAPTVAVSPSGDRLYVSSDWYVYSTADVIPSGTDHWTVPWDGSVAGTAAAAGSSSSDTCSEWGRGFIDDTQVYVACYANYAGVPAIERRDLTGAVIGRTEVPRSTGGEGGALLLHVVGSGLFLWDAIDLRIHRVDLRTGELTEGAATRPTASASDGDLYAALGRRIGEAIAPSAAAKFLLQPAMTVSPDGSRLYALGVSQANGALGSLGVFVFDAASLAEIDHWDATADYGSIAISADGAFVYAAGGFGRDAAGIGSKDNASVTVFDASDGSIRLIAGDLLSSDMWFQGPVLR